MLAAEVDDELVVDAVRLVLSFALRRPEIAVLQNLKIC